MREVLRTHSLSWAHSIRLALEAEGIEAVIQDENSLGYVGLAGELRIAVVDTADAERAQEVIAGLERRPAAASGRPPSWSWQRRGLKTIGLGFIFRGFLLERGEARSRRDA